MHQDHPDELHRSATDVVANGLRHRVLEWKSEEPAGATALLLHGYMDAAGTWDLVARRLAAAGLRVIAPDLRGYGESERAPAGSFYHFPDYVADVADLVDQLVNTAPLFVVGHSMGGTVATLYAGAFPEKVSRLALLEGVGPPDSSFDGMPERMRGWIDQVRKLRERDADPRGVMATREDALRRLAVNHTGVPAEVLRARLHDLVAEDGAGTLRWKADPLHRPVGPMPFFARGYVEFARRITCPVLIVSGGSHGFHVEDEEARVAAFARAERFEIADAGHMMHWTRPEALADRLIAFWGPP
jgi:pimeloyl-ACP methyl ester carboxylesterase